MSFSIRTYKFQKPPVDKNSAELLSEHTMGVNWPVVYLIHGNGELYVGETSSAVNRIEQHLSPTGPKAEDRKKLDTVEIIFDDRFNKSSILDIEHSLIDLFRFEIEQDSSSDNKSRYFKKLQNANNGQSTMHNYYNRVYYQDEVKDIWSELKKHNLATNDYQTIVNDAIFKFSPYKALNEEQHEVCLSILEEIMDALEAEKGGSKAEYTAIVRGLAGTGKTIVLLNLLARVMDAERTNLKTISEESKEDNDEDDSEITLGIIGRETELVKRINEYVAKNGKIRIAYVAQMTSLRNTIKKVVKQIPKVKKNDAKGPFDVVNYTTSSQKKFDILLIDEAHRLFQYKKIQNRKSFKDKCKALYGDGARPEDYTTLDWLLSCSKNRVIVYDEFQTVKESDITPAQFKQALKRKHLKPKDYFLKQQMRCRAGMVYTDFLNRIFDNKPTKGIESFENYDLLLYEDPNRLIDDIAKRNVTYGLSRVTAGYGWQWDRKKYDACFRMFKRHIANNGLKGTRSAMLDYYHKHLRIEDGLIEFDGKTYLRNLDYNWILEGNPLEIGCIHTSQGYDLNYVGVLFGPEIDYSKKRGIVVYPDRIKDTNSVGTSFVGLSKQEKTKRLKAIKTFVINAYKVMMERGIRGCYVYAYNKGLRDYFSKVFKSAE